MVLPFLCGKGTKKRKTQVFSFCFFPIALGNPQIFCNFATMCKFTILVAVYNAEQFLDQCLDSLLGQTLADIQIVCIDDCSTDRSPEILRQWAATDHRLLVLRTPENGGQARARNLGLQQAQGEYTCFVDSDDYLAPDALEKMYAALTADPEADCALFSVMMKYADSSQNHPYPNRTDRRRLTGEEAFRLAIDNWKIHGVYAVRTEIHRRFPYDTTTRVYSDDNTTMMHFLHSRHVLLLPDAVYFYRQHADSSTHAVSIRRFDQLEANLSLRRQMEQCAEEGLLTNPEEVLTQCETFRFLHIIEMIGYLYRQKTAFSSRIRAEITLRLRSAYSVLNRSRIAPRIRHHLLYYPFRSFRVFSIQVRLLYFLRKG